MRIILVCLLNIVIVSCAGCSYPRVQTQKLDELTFDNKRLEGKTRAVQEFIRPEETEEVLTELSYGKDRVAILEILNYTQQLKQRSDKKEFWQYPEETIRKGGDCEDKTFLLLSMLIQAGIDGAQGVKGRCLGSGHMWVEYNGYILDTLKKQPKLIPINKSLGYIPYFKFDQHKCYYCSTERRLDE